MSGAMYHRDPPKGNGPKPTIYNTPKTVKENEEQKEAPAAQEIKFLQEAHVTEITLGSQKLRVMDASHIQGVINMQEKHHKEIKQLQKTVNTQSKVQQQLSQQIQTMQKSIDELKGKLNGNYL